MTVLQEQAQPFLRRQLFLLPMAWRDAWDGPLHLIGLSAVDPFKSTAQLQTPPSNSNNQTMRSFAPDADPSEERNALDFKFAQNSQDLKEVRQISYGVKSART
jgi:hypothetical protein